MAFDRAVTSGRPPAVAVTASGRRREWPSHLQAREPSPSQGASARPGRRVSAAGRRRRIQLPHPQPREPSPSPVAVGLVLGLPSRPWRRGLRCRTAGIRMRHGRPPDIRTTGALAGSWSVTGGEQLPQRRRIAIDRHDGQSSRQVWTASAVRQTWHGSGPGAGGVAIGGSSGLGVGIDGGIGDLRFSQGGVMAGNGQAKAGRADHFCTPLPLFTCFLCFQGNAWRGIAWESFHAGCVA